MGYSVAVSAGFRLDSIVVIPGMALKKTPKELTNVVVTAGKPLIQVKAGMTIMNVQGCVNAAGNTLLELLRNSPGISLGTDDRTSLNRKTSVKIYVAGNQRE